MTSQLTTKTLTISGDTYKAREQLKSEKFTWDSGNKSWSREVNVDDEGKVYYGEFEQGSMANYRHHWKCYCKSDRFTIEVAA